MQSKGEACNVMLTRLVQQINIYNQSESTIGDVNKQIAKVQTAITDLNVKITTCNDVNKEKESNITKLTTLITNQKLQICTNDFLIVLLTIFINGIDVLSMIFIK